MSLSSEERHACKQFALDHAGEIFTFMDGPDKLKGRIVGYYFAFAFLVMECDERPINCIDPIIDSLSSNGIVLTKGSYYTFCSITDIVTGKYKDKVWPHKCSRCGFSALILFKSVECSNYQCINYKPNIR